MNADFKDIETDTIKCIECVFLFFQVPFNQNISHSYFRMKTMNKKWNNSDNHLSDVHMSASNVMMTSLISFNMNILDLYRDKLRKQFFSTIIIFFGLSIKMQLLFRKIKRLSL